MNAHVFDNCMRNQGWNKVFFLDSIQNYDFTKNPEHVMHILCIEGSMNFFFQDVHYNIVPGDYVILTNMSLVSFLSESKGYNAITMGVSESFVMSMAVRNNYGIIGHLALLQNPVMKLSANDFQRCRTEMLRLRERLNDKTHLFYEDMIGYLLMAHITDLYNIHARGQVHLQVSEHTARLMRNFVELLYNGEYIHHRDIPYYASCLCITPHYLSEICKKTSGKPASYWIDRFTLHEITNLLCRKGLTLTEISSRMNFSSVSYFSRYVHKRIGVYPTEYRNRLIDCNL